MYGGLEKSRTIVEETINATQFTKRHTSLLLCKLSRYSAFGPPIVRILFMDYKVPDRANFLIQEIEEWLSPLSTTNSPFIAAPKEPFFA
jgi:hypothetical protein